MRNTNNKKKIKKEDNSSLVNYFTNPTDDKVKILAHLINLTKESPAMLINILANYIESIDPTLAEAWLDIKLED